MIAQSHYGALICRNDSMERFSVDVIARDRNCQIFPLNFQ
jgi:hypothetical protein